ncbi:hypothetical protein RchiOBHm_Chr3g0450131 [Rosa chinensis]|uniref:Uncharacterized protein n=1 Tax=Rosa chinensis TaxID=74649 RepID=A0A2P6R5M8_ROSCH|nr:hypothetical protein RchiOBHm_Chr3g0450131 [Rosa chinensis]
MKYRVTVLAGDHDKKEMVKLEVDGGGDSALVEARFSDGVYDKPLSCFGCGIGWFSFLLGFAFPPLWYYATVLYFGNYLKDPRERPGLAASAIAVRMTQELLLQSNYRGNVLNQTLIFV